MKSDLYFLEILLLYFTTDLLRKAMGQPPDITISSYDPTPPEGSNINVTATITSASVIESGSVKWFVSGGDLPFGATYSSRIIDGAIQCTLSLHSISVSDSAKYIVTATNQDGASSAAANIQVQGAFCFKKYEDLGRIVDPPPPNIVTVPGQWIPVPCLVRGTVWDNIDSNWIVLSQGHSETIPHDNSSDLYHQAIYQIDRTRCIFNNQMIIIKTTQEMHGAICTCAEIIEVDGGNPLVIESNVTLVVLVIPRIISGPVQLEDQTPMRLQCHFNASIYPGVTIVMWKRNNIDLSNSSLYSIIQSISPDTEDQVVSILIINTTDLDGTYTCYCYYNKSLVTSREPIVSNKSSITLYMEQQPVIKLNNYDSTPPEGSNINITATITSASKIESASVKWFVVGRDLPSGATYSTTALVNGTMQCTLLLHSISVSDSANYTITATNEYGNSTKSANIQVKDDHDNGSLWKIIVSSALAVVGLALIMILIYMCRRKYRSRSKAADESTHLLSSGDGSNSASRQIRRVTGGIIKSTDLSTALSSACKSVSDAWNLKRLDSINLNGTGTVIAVLDTTIDQHFPSFTGKEISVIDCLPGVPVVSTMHGTICSAVAVGLQSDTTPRGVAPCAKLIVYRIAEGENSSINAIMNALDDIRNKVARGEQIDVVSISYDCDENSEDTLHDKIKILTKMGVIFVAAAGNRGQYQARACIPARFSNVISVGALDRYGDKARFTPSVKIDVYAPGEDIEFLGCKFWGTSYATPAVAGLVLLLKQWANFIGSPAKENINRVEVLQGIFKKEMFMKSDAGNDVFEPVEFFRRLRTRWSSD